MKPLLLAFVFLVALSLTTAQSQILFQGFNWESWRKQGGWYNFLRSQVPDIARARVTHVWLPPPSHSVSEQAVYDELGSHGWSRSGGDRLELAQLLPSS
ncbi:hypothetical protein MUK42_04954 [Musa troglodytarum]|uniref:Uncharacterized protein n=1 Tax=Musa troglodytarum TaxID=320322 RepID=A0A9E7GPW4_9LILI|nr:hypothetical protein MUK42_04954 [Musa troglodytarum]